MMHCLLGVFFQIVISVVSRCLGKLVFLRTFLRMGPCRNSWSRRWKSAQTVLFILELNPNLLQSKLLMLPSRLHHVLFSQHVCRVLMVSSTKSVVQTSERPQLESFSLSYGIVCWRVLQAVTLYSLAVLSRSPLEPGTWLMQWWVSGRLLL